MHAGVSGRAETRSAREGRSGRLTPPPRVPRSRAETSATSAGDHARCVEQQQQQQQGDVTTSRIGDGTSLMAAVVAVAASSVVVAPAVVVVAGPMDILSPVGKIRRS